ncbi:HAD family hydrolase, partial [Rhodococcus fascians]
QGARAAVLTWVQAHGGRAAPAVTDSVNQIAQSGGTPLVVATVRGDAATVLGVIALSDVVKPGIAERFAELRAMGIRTVMITG